MITLVLGFLIGIAFGFFLQKASVIRYDRQIGALRLIDMTIVKFMLSAILVGMIGIYILKDYGIVNLRVLPTQLGGNIIGGLLFGLGWGLLGYCPGTSMGAIGEGRIDALFGILGMIIGAGLYAETYPFLARTILSWGVIRIHTIPELFQLNHWYFIPLISLLVIVLFLWFEKKNL